MRQNTQTWLWLRKEKGPDFHRSCLSPSLVPALFHPLLLCWKSACCPQLPARHQPWGRQVATGKSHRHRTEAAAILREHADRLCATAQPTAVEREGLPKTWNLRSRASTATCSQTQSSPLRTHRTPPPSHSVMEGFPETPSPGSLSWKQRPGW